VMASTEAAMPLASGNEAAPASHKVIMSASAHTQFRCCSDILRSVDASSIHATAEAQV